MLIGIIMYISLFKSEIGSKLRPRSMFQSPLFTYRYGHSFILFVIGCISAEIVGTLNFFLFIQIREIGREKVSFMPIFFSFLPAFNLLQVDNIDGLDGSIRMRGNFRLLMHFKLFHSNRI